MEKCSELYSGKAKTVYTTADPNRLILFFRDDTSAFDGQKVERFPRKGEINNKINAFIMEKLAAVGIPTHFERLLSAQESLVKRLTMFPIECVVRNLATGSLCRRLGIEEGMGLEPPVFEFFLKNDVLHDPIINESHIRTFNLASKEQVQQMEEYTFKINDALKPLFSEAGLLLVDYKLEFGDFQGRVVLGDEFTLDGCRLWDATTRQKFDKDRFRQGLGGLIEAYEEVGWRLGVPL